MYLYYLFIISFLYYPFKIVLKRTILKKFRTSPINTELLEFIAFAVFIGLLFNNIIDSTSVNTSDFVISKPIVLVSFVATIISLGIGLGMKYASEMFEKYYPITEDNQLKPMNFIHKVYAQLWIHISFLSLYFLFALMEVSRERVEIPLVVEILMYSASLATGVMYGIRVSREVRGVRMVLALAGFLIIACLATFIYESIQTSSGNFVIALSCLLFSVFYLVSAVVAPVLQDKILTRRVVKENQVMGTEPSAAMSQTELTLPVPDAGYKPAITISPPTGEKKPIRIKHNQEEPNVRSPQPSSFNHSSVLSLSDLKQI